MTEKSAQEKLAELDHGTVMPKQWRVLLPQDILPVRNNGCQHGGSNGKGGTGSRRANTCAAGIVKAVAGFGGPLMPDWLAGCWGDGWAPKQVTGYGYLG